MWYGRHELDAPSDDEALSTRHHSLRRPMHRLRRGRSLSVDRNPRYALGPSSCKYGPPCDIACLRTHLRSAAEDHVVHGSAVYAGPFDELRQHLCRKVDRVPAGQHTTSLAVGSADGVHNECLSLPVPVGYPWHSVDHADADEAPDEIGHTGCEHTYDHLPQGAANRGAACRLRK